METNNNQSNNFPRLLTLSDVAKILNFSIKTIRTWATTRKLPGLIKINGEWRVDESKLYKTYFLR